MEIKPRELADGLDEGRRERGALTVDSEVVPLYLLENIGRTGINAQLPVGHPSGHESVQLRGKSEPKI